MAPDGKCARAGRRGFQSRANISLHDAVGRGIEIAACVEERPAGLMNHVSYLACAIHLHKGRARCDFTHFLTRAFRPRLPGRSKKGGRHASYHPELQSVAHHLWWRLCLRTTRRRYGSLLFTFRSWRREFRRSAEGSEGRTVGFPLLLSRLDGLWCRMCVHHMTYSA